MGKIFEMIWYGSLIALAAFTIGLSTYARGVFGFFFAVGVLVTFLVLSAVIEYIVCCFVGFLATRELSLQSWREWDRDG